MANAKSLSWWIDRCRPALVALLLVAGAGQAVAAGSPDEGRGIAEQYCKSCHAIGTSGESAHPQAPSLPEIAARYDVWNLQEALAEGIVVGHDDMPEFALTPDQIEALLIYMDTMTPPPDKR